MGDFFTTIMARSSGSSPGSCTGSTRRFDRASGWTRRPGWTWALSIVGLVVVMRAAMIPLFVKQIMASRKMQMIQPELQKIQKKYKGKSDPESRQAMTQETMELYKKEGTNPFSSCLPILRAVAVLLRPLPGAQRPRRASPRGDEGPIGPITQPVAAQAEQATIFGAQLSDTFLGVGRAQRQDRHGASSSSSCRRRRSSPSAS